MTSGPATSISIRQPSARELWDEYGCSVIPCGEDKKPIHGLLWKPFQTRLATSDEMAKWEAEKPAAWAVVTGKISGRVTFDFDGEIGKALANKWHIKSHRLTGGGYYHVDVIHPGWPVPTLNGKSKVEMSKRWPGLDVRGDGGYVITLGCNERGSYSWLRDPTPEAMTVIPAEVWEFLYECSHPKSNQNGASKIATQRSDTSQDFRVSAELLINRALDDVMAGCGRNNAGHSLACQLRDNGYPQSEAEVWMRDYRNRCPSTNSKGQQELYSDAEVSATVRGVFASAPREPWNPRTAGTSTRLHRVDPSVKEDPPQAHVRGTEPPSFDLSSETFNDAGNAQRLIGLHGDDLRFCHAMRSWLVWDDTRWRVDETGQARRKAKLAMGEFYRKAVKASNEAAQKFAIKSLDERRIASCLRMAESEIYVEPQQLDTHSLLINFRNGTFDVANGTLREHRRTDYITKLIRYEYNEQASADTWFRFLDRIMGGGPDASAAQLAQAENMTAYLQRSLGYSVTGDVIEKAVFLPFGHGNNGKSTLLSTVRGLVEEYAVQLDINTLMIRQETNNTQSDLARLRGARFVQTSETEEGQRLAEGKLKRITQGMPDGKITATRKYENSIEFSETHKLWMDCNHRPVIRGTESAIWNRLHLIPFTVSLTEEEIDPHLPTKLKAEAEGILAWLVQGACDWYRNRLQRPPEIDAARTEYRKDMDPLEDFREEACVIGAGSCCYSGTLYAAYLAWVMQAHAAKPVNNKVFKRLMEEKGFVYDPTKYGIRVTGIGMKETRSEPEDSGAGEGTG